MSRAQFDKQQVIDAATNLFWQQGYQAASMQQIVQRTGLKPGSLYLAFGNKQGLFAEAIKAYGANGRAQLQALFASTDAIGRSICEILSGMITDAISKDYCSCFLVKAQLELATEGNTHAALLQLVQEELAAVEVVYANALRREFGEQKAQALARSIMLHIFGLRVYGCKHNSAEQLLETLQLGLSWLPWREAPGQ